MGRKNKSKKSKGKASQQGSTTTTYSYKACHSEAKVVFQVGSCKVILGAAKDINRSMEILKPDVLMSVGGSIMMNTATDSALTTTGQSPILFPKSIGIYHEPLATITIDWPDQMAAPMPKEWWEAFVDDLRTFNGSIAIFCMGGHGRTGTAAAIILSMGKALLEGTDVVKWLRENYCVEAVETDAQIDYLAKMGVKTQERPSERMGGYQVGNYAQYQQLVSELSASKSQKDYTAWSDVTDDPQGPGPKESASIHKGRTAGGCQICGWHDDTVMAVEDEDLGGVMDLCKDCRKRYVPNATKAPDPEDVKKVLEQNWDSVANKF